MPANVSAQKVPAFKIAAPVGTTQMALQFSYVDKSQVKGKVDFSLANAGSYYYDMDTYWSKYSQEDSFGNLPDTIKAHRAKINNVIIDRDFGENYRPTSLVRMFSYMTEITSIEGLNYLNTENVTSMHVMFSYCQKLRRVDLSNFKTSKVTDFSKMFEMCNFMTSLDVSSFDTSAAQNMYGMFCACWRLKSLELGQNFNTGNVVNMGEMFANCHALENIDVSGFNTAKVWNMSYMFSACNSVKKLDVSKFQTDSLRGMYGMFNGCWVLSDLDVSHFNTSKVEVMDRLFRMCQKLTNLDVSNFDMRKVKSASEMFDNCSGLTSLDVSKWETPVLEKMSNMFSAMNITRLDVRNFNFSNVKNMSFAFASAKLKELLANQTLLEASPENYEGVFMYVGTNTPCRLILPKAQIGLAESVFTSKQGSGTVDDPYYYGWLDGKFTLYEADRPTATLATNSTTGIKVLTFLPYKDLSYNDPATDGADGSYDLPAANALKPAWISDNAADNAKVINVIFDPEFKNARPINCRRWFAGMTGLERIYGFTYLDTRNTTDMSEMFLNCKSLTSLDITGLNTTNVTSMYAMFKGCSGLTSLNVKNFRTYSVTSMASMFEGCYKLETIGETDARHFSDDSNQHIEAMFKDCRALKSLDLDRFTTEKIMEYDDIFNGCWALQSLNIIGFSTESMGVYRMPRMFANCRSLETIRLGGLFICSYVEDASRLFDNCKNLKNISVVSPQFSFAKATNLSNMFNDCDALTSASLHSFTSRFNAKNATDISYMFAYCDGLQELDLTLAGFDASKLTDIVGLCQESKNLKEITVGNIDFRNIDDGVHGWGAFYDMSSKEKPILLNIDKDFDKGVLGTMQSGNPDYYVWREGYFTLGSEIGIHNAMIKGDGDGKDANSGWYTLDGRRLDAQPTQKGVYIHNNKKVVVR